jgi:hypothetical protein
MGLLSPAGFGELMIFLVIVAQVYSPGFVLTIIPVVVVLVAGIIDSHLNAVVIRSGGGHDCQRCRKGSSQQERTDVTMCKAHVKILQENSAISVLERREAKVNF